MAVGTLEHPLFRTLVVCGASLVSAGCGGRTGSDGSASAGWAGIEVTGGSGGRSAGQAGEGGLHAGSGSGQGARSGAQGLCPDHCESPSQFTCDDYRAGINCRCNGAAPKNAEACETRWDFRCATSVRPPECGLPTLTLGPTFGCGCSEGLRPEDCARTSQFLCEVYTPIAVGCRCDPEAPSVPEDCPSPARFSCQEYDPDIGCSCWEVLPIR